MLIISTLKSIHPPIISLDQLTSTVRNSHPDSFHFPRAYFIQLTMVLIRRVSVILFSAKFLLYVSPITTNSGGDQPFFTEMLSNRLTSNDQLLANKLRRSNSVDLRPFFISTSIQSGQDKTNNDNTPPQHFGSQWSIRSICTAASSHSLHFSIASLVTTIGEFVGNLKSLSYDYWIPSVIS